jgi:hypothetical protein
MSAPPVPREVPGAGDWESAEMKLGTIPEDYKDFVSRFGTSKIDDFLWIFTPTASSPHLDLLFQVPLQLNVLKEIKKEVSPSDLDHYPSSVLPFGKSDNGEVLFWISGGPAAEWNVLVHDSRAPKRETFDLNMTTFVSGVLTGEVRCSIFPNDFPSKYPHFTIVAPRDP